MYSISTEVPPVNPTRPYIPAISVRQPYASLIMCGFKSLETRDWTTSYRGPIIIHVSKSQTQRELEIYNDDIVKNACKEIGYTDLASMPRGMILGHVNLTAAHHADTFTDPAGMPDCSINNLISCWWELDYALEFHNPTVWRIQPQWRGQQGIWTIPLAELDAACPEEATAVLLQLANRHPVLDPLLSHRPQSRQSAMAG